MTDIEGPRVVLVIAGVDPSGGAGLVADVAEVASRGLHPAALPTALTLQDSHSCRSISPVSAGWIEEELGLLVSDIGERVGAVKLGMLASERIAEVVARGISPLIARGAALVVDPVLRASVGAELLQGEPARALGPLLSMCTVITPNRDEAARLCGMDIDNREGQRAAAARLRSMGARAALVKGGHLPGDEVVDLLDDGGEPLWLSSPRAPSTPHGTGCALATSIACELAAGRALREACAYAHMHIARRIVAAVQIGRGRLFLRPPIRR